MMQLAAARQRVRPLSQTQSEGLAATGPMWIQPTLGVAMHRHQDHLDVAFECPVRLGYRVSHHARVCDASARSWPPSFLEPSPEGDLLEWRLKVIERQKEAAVAHCNSFADLLESHMRRSLKAVGTTGTRRGYTSSGIGTSTKEVTTQAATGIHAARSQRRAGAGMRRQVSSGLLACRQANASGCTRTTSSAIAHWKSPQQQQRQHKQRRHQAATATVTATARRAGRRRRFSAGDSDAMLLCGGMPRCEATSGASSTGSGRTTPWLHAQARRDGADRSVLAEAPQHGTMWYDQGNLPVDRQDGHYHNECGTRGHPCRHRQQHRSIDAHMRPSRRGNTQYLPASSSNCTFPEPSHSHAVAPEVVGANCTAQGFIVGKERGRKQKEVGNSECATGGGYFETSRRQLYRCREHASSGAIIDSGSLNSQPKQVVVVRGNKSSLTRTEVFHEGLDLTHGFYCKPRTISRQTCYAC